MTPDRFAALIPFHLNGTLSGTENDRLERHLPACAACRALLDEARLVQELGKGAAEAWTDHVQAQHLERFALDPASTPSQLAGWIGSHVEACGACRAAVERLRATADADDLFPLQAAPAREGRAAGSAEEGGASGGRPGRGWLARTLLHPIPAAVYLILVFILVPLAWRGGGRSAAISPGETGAGASLVDLPVLRTPLRGVIGETEIVRTGAPYVPLAIELPAASLRPVVPLRLIFGGRDGTPPVRLEVPPARVERALEDSGLLVVLLPAAVLEPGRHPVELRRADDQAGPPLVAGTVRVVLAGE